MHTLDTSILRAFTRQKKRKNHEGNCLARGEGHDKLSVSQVPVLLRRNTGSPSLVVRDQSWEPRLTPVPVGPAVDSQPQPAGPAMYLGMTDGAEEMRVVRGCVESSRHRHSPVFQTRSLVPRGHLMQPEVQRHASPQASYLGRYLLRLLLPLAS